MGPDYLVAMPRHARLVVLVAGGLLLAAAPALLRAQAPATRQRVLDAMTLPRLASDLRDEGMSDYELRDALDAMREARLPAGDAVQALRAEFDAGGEHPGPWADSGARVRQQLRAGLRGKALADAIKRLRRETPRHTVPKAQ